MTSQHDIQDSDLVVFCRNLRPDRAEFLRAAIAMGIPVLYDLDDNFFEIASESAIARTLARPEQLAMLREYLAAASLVRVYSRPLLQRVALLNPRVQMVASAVDLRQIRRPVKAAGGPIKLIYATSRLDDSLGQIFLPALRRLTGEEGSRIEVHFWGPRPPAELRMVRHHAVVHDYDRFLRRFSAAGFEIGLAPLADDVFHRSKTNTKFREYGACGIAGVYSDVEVYSHCVRNGETGLLVANDTEAWYQALRQLVDNACLRRRIQQQARVEVEEHYSQERFETVFFHHIEQLVGSGRRQPIISHPPPQVRSKASRLPIAGSLGLISQGIKHLRHHGWARCWNSLCWVGSSGWSLAWLRWHLRASRIIR
jgi:glycosyltransferase involved in cell wall biosynthesis